MINMFYHIMDLVERDDLIKILLGSMDFSLCVRLLERYYQANFNRDSHLRVMLSKALTACPKVL